MGVLLEEAVAATWVTSLVGSLLPQGEIEFTDVFLLPSPTDVENSSTPWLFRKLEQWSRAGNGSPGLAGALPSLQRHKMSGSRDHGLTAEDRSLIGSGGLDVLLCATASPLPGECTGLARCGTWSLLFGEPDFTGYRPPYWREVYEGQEVTRVFLLAHDREFARGRVIESFVLATQGSLRFTLDQTGPLKAARLALCRALSKTAELDMTPQGGIEMDVAEVTPRWPSTWETAEFICRKLGRSAVLRASSRGKTVEWFVCVRRTPETADWRELASGEPFVELPNPPGHYYADPFIVESGSRTWLFVEDWLHSEGRGRLACMEVRSDGSFGEPVVILDKPYHLSYPQVFQHRGEFFMIPETYYGGNVQLYRASRFPFEWKLESVLLEDVQLVDTTAFHYDNHWYFFTSTADQPEEAYLFTADRIDGAWNYHPSNPVSTDIRRLRGAGAIFRSGKTWLRPAQDCSRGYGYALAFNEIRRLSPSEYVEVQTGNLLPDWAPGTIGTHTFNSSPNYQVLDGQRLVRLDKAGKE